MFNFVLVANEQVALLAVPAGIIEGNRIRRVNVNKQGHFALPGFFLTVGTAGQPRLRVGVKNKVIFSRQFAQL